MRDPHSKPRRGVLGRLGRWCAVHAWLVLGLWLVALVAATVGHRALGGTYSDDFTLPGSAAQTGANLLKAHQPASGGVSGQLVFSVEAGTVSAQRGAVESAVTDVGHLAHVLSVTDPLAGSSVSPNGRVAYATVQFDQNPASLGSGHVSSVDAAVAPARAAGVRVDYGGALGQADRPAGGDRRSELLGVAVAAKAAVLNLLSIGAAYGVVVAVFQWGWGGRALGVGEDVPIESYVPMMMFAIVFGLSMDYEVFLISRIREAWLETGDNRASVAHGPAATARVITCAALIMTSVFLAFLLSTDVVVKILALGLGVSVIIDATVIRLLVVPAAMFLLGRANWWLPEWLDRLLPNLDPHPVPATAEPEHEVNA
jgi:uncharacterized membrane protein YdfJ with MMPL/SSD domain